MLARELDRRVHQGLPQAPATRLGNDVELLDVGLVAGREERGADPHQGHAVGPIPGYQHVGQSFRYQLPEALGEELRPRGRGVELPVEAIEQDGGRNRILNPGYPSLGPSISPVEVLRSLHRVQDREAVT